jgi:beta-lactamase regulating signal transducer with metallopeptidase domain
MSMTGWLGETLIWTAVLIVAVLLLRRPVARWFGPQMAYALWALPLLRLALPPVELPAWLLRLQTLQSVPVQPQISILDPGAPVATTNGLAGSVEAVSGLAIPITPLPANPVPANTVPAAAVPTIPVPEAVVSGTDAPIFDFETVLEIGVQVGMTVWFIGAAIFLWLRFSAYFRLRSELLDGAREVGRSGNVRLVETSGTMAPLAFGVIDKVVALPLGFLAQADLTARDLALAHELAHHKGRDLLINMIVQPLFALHWFNPLGYYGWLALRRDQEAACDARVLSARSAETRAAYAAVIVSFAAGPNVAAARLIAAPMAAPMACPVLGDKSIIHRLRSLKMTETSLQRRIAGRVMLGAAVLALPLTASITYAESIAPQPPAARVAALASEVMPQPPAPPAPPALPALPVPPVPPAVAGSSISAVDPDTGETRAPDRDDTVIIISVDENGDERGTRRRTERRVARIHTAKTGAGLSEAEIEEILAEVRESLAQVDGQLAEIPALIEQTVVEIGAIEGRTIVRMECDNDSDEAATTTANADGSRVVMICQSRMMAQALTGLREAREALFRNREIKGETLVQVLREIERQIDRWEDSTG